MTQDRRVKKTINAIRQATVELLTTTPIGKLSIKEICNKADISRSTFYLHFYDASDVIEEMYNDIALNVNKLFEKFDFTKLLTNPKPCLEQIVEFVKQNIDLYQLLLINDYHSDFRRRLKNILQDNVIKANYYRFRNKTAFEYSVCYIMSGLVETICDNMSDLKTEKCALLVDTLSRQISQGFELN